MAEVVLRDFVNTRVEISGETGEQERAYKYLEKHYPNLKYVFSSDKTSFHIVGKLDEKILTKKITI